MGHDGRSGAGAPCAAKAPDVLQALTALDGLQHAALKTLTGQTFSTTADAKKWFGANERTFGFHW